MLAFELPLEKSSTKPYAEMYDLEVLFDTGAGIPVFNLPPDIVETQFGGTLIGQSGISGIVGEKDTAEVYRLKRFDIQDLHLTDIPVLVYKEINNNIDADIILGSTILGNGSKLTIDHQKDMIICEMPESVMRAGKLWHRKDGVWRILDYENGRWVVKE